MSKTLTLNCDSKCENFEHESNYGTGTKWCTWGNSKKKKLLKVGPNKIKCGLIVYILNQL